MGIKHWVAKQGGKAANKIAKLSALSPEQVIQIQERRDQYFTELQSKVISYLINSDNTYITFYHTVSHINLQKFKICTLLYQS